MQEESTLGEVVAFARDLRKRCDWDRAQTPRTLRPYLREEVAELEEAIALGDEARIRGELGDLLLHFCFQVDMAEERGAFTLADVTRHLVAKMKRRHPHLYAHGPKPDWERLKTEERQRDARAAGRSHGILGHLPPALPELERAFRFQERAAAVGFDWDDVAGPLDKLEEEVREARKRPAAEIGDVLFAAVNVARKAGVHPSLALEAATAKFAERFQALERLAAERGVEIGRAPLQELDRLWDEVKRNDAGGVEDGGSR